MNRRVGFALLCLIFVAGMTWKVGDSTVTAQGNWYAEYFANPTPAGVI